jgi:integrase
MSKPIRQKGSPYWYYDFRINGSRVQGSTGLTVKRDAQAFIDRLRYTILMPNQNRPEITLDNACGVYQDYAETLASWKDARYMIDALVDGLGADTLISKITQRDLIAYVSSRRNGRKNSTVNRELDVIRAVWSKVAQARYEIGEMPNWKALRLKQPRLTHRTLGIIEEKERLSNIRDDVRGAVQFLLMSGWRRSEVLGLRWSDLDFPNRTAVTPIKGGDMVTRPLTNPMIVLISNQPKDGPFVFTYVCERTSSKIRQKGQRYPLTITVLRSAWKQANQAMNADGDHYNPIRIHDLRHTRATRMLRATGNLVTVKKALQHRNLKTTLQYAYVLDEDVRAGLDAPDSLNTPEIDWSDKAKTKL